MDRPRWLTAATARRGNYGLLADAYGSCRCMRAMWPITLPSCSPEVQRLRERFGIKQLVMVDDRGMILETAANRLLLSRKPHGY